MINMSHDEAILFRILANFFGKDRVIPGMSVNAVCGEKLPLNYRPKASFDIKKWAKENKCLFTIVDNSDNPCMVIEFFSGFNKVVEVVDTEHQRFLPDILQSAGIRYITMTNSEFSEMLDPGANLDFYSFLKAKVTEDQQIDSINEHSD
jgi:hypothetical protein